MRRRVLEHALSLAVEEHPKAVDAERGAERHADQFEGRKHDDEDARPGLESHQAEAADQARKRHQHQEEENARADHAENRAGGRRFAGVVGYADDAGNTAHDEKDPDTGQNHQPRINDAQNPQDLDVLRHRASPYALRKHYTQNEAKSSRCVPGYLSNVMVESAPNRL